jgi:ribosomal protein L37AE/L43A
MEKLAKNNQYNHYCEKCKGWKLHARGPKFYRCLACNTKVARANKVLHPTAFGVDWAAPDAKDITVKTFIPRENGGG